VADVARELDQGDRVHQNGVMEIHREGFVSANGDGER
jgi:hypothetical protein